jgi:hypothetical protein
MNNQWGDSSLWMNPVTNDWTNVIFPDDPSSLNGWNETTAGNSAGDRRGLITIGEPNLLSGASICSDYAFVYDRSGTTRFENVQNVFNKASTIKTFYNDFLTFPCHSPQFSGVKEQQQLIDIQLFPNPNTGKFTIQTDHQMKNARIEIRSLDGTLVYQSRISTTFTPIELNVADGMYVVHVVAEDSVIAKKVIIGTEK